MNTQADSNIKFDRDAFSAQVAGFKIGTRAVRKAYGPRGVNASIEAELYPYHEVANDARKIVSLINPTDPYQRLGISYLKELMDRADKVSKDGRKTTAIMAEAILDGVAASDESPLDLKRGLDALIPAVEAAIDASKSPVTVDDVDRVASIAAESEALGKAIGDTFRAVGRDGVVHIEGSDTHQTYFTATEGIRFSGTGYLAASMAGRDGKAAYENPVVLVTKRRISSLGEINPLMEKLTTDGSPISGRPLVIFTDDMDPSVASAMIRAHRDGVAKILIVKAPTLWKGYVFEDFAKATGATIVEDATGVTFKGLRLDHLGTCARISVDEDEAVITGGADVSGHVERLRAKGDNDSLIRLQWLNSRTATLKIGSNSESELSYLKPKAEDGAASARLALMDGAVAGAGMALHRAAESMPDTPAGRVMAAALREPRRQILASGVAGDPDPRVLDAAKVVKNAVRNAVGLASTFITSGMAITLPPKTVDQAAMDMLKAKGMRF